MRCHPSLLRAWRICRPFCILKTSTCSMSRSGESDLSGGGGSCCGEGGN
jgi:hypothetical protein